MPWIEQEFAAEFQQWILDFPVAQRPAIWKLLDKYRQNKEIIVFETRKATEEYLA